MTTYTATAHMRPTVRFRRVAVVLSALVVALATYLESLDLPDDGGQNCQSEQALIMTAVTSSDVQPCVPDSILSGEYRVVPPPR